MLTVSKSRIRSAAVVNSLAGSQTDQAPSVASVSTALAAKLNSNAVGTAAAKNVPNAGVDASSTQVVMGDDSRLTDDRTPLSHGHAATDIGSGTVSNAEFACLDGVTSAIQTQLNGKLSATISSPSSGQYARFNGTAWVNAAIQAADVPTLNQNTTGTAANVTATNNGTLTTLSALSLPSSQVVGLGTAATQASSAFQASDATLLALAAWGWTSGREVPTFTAADTLSVLRVGIAANNLIQLDGSGRLPAVDGSQLTGITGGATVLCSQIASNTTLASTNSAWLDTTLNVVLTEGVWDYEALSIWTWAASGKFTQTRLKITAGSITKTDGRPIGFTQVINGSESQSIYTAATAVISGNGQSSATNFVEIYHKGFLVVPSGGATLTLQWNGVPGTGENVTLEQGTYLKAVKR